MNAHYERIELLEGTMGPIGRSDHAAVMHNDKFYVHGGERTNCNKLSDFWEFDFDRQIWIKIETDMKGPSKRSAHEITTHKNNIYVFGGFDSRNEECGDLWKFSLDTLDWERMKSNGRMPCARHYHTLNTYGDYLVLFGGYTLADEENSEVRSHCNDLVLYDIANNVWIEKKGHEYARFAHTSAIYKKKLYVFGGDILKDVKTVTTNDLIEYDFETNEWSDTFYTGNAPSKRKTHGCAVVKNSMFVWGSVKDGYIHEYSFSQKRWYQLNKTSTLLYGHAMAPRRNSFIVMGGFNDKKNMATKGIHEYSTGAGRDTVISNFDSMYARSFSISDVMIITTTTAFRHTQESLKRKNTPLDDDTTSTYKKIKLY